MYKLKQPVVTQLDINDTVEGETIELKMERLINNQDEITDLKQPIYTRPEDGVIASFNIRHDHWDDAITQSSVMAEKGRELDQARLEKRKEDIEGLRKEEKALKEIAKRGSAEQKTDDKTEV